MTPAENTLCCTYCGLPVGQPWRSGAPTNTDQPIFCCFGCRFAAEVTQARGEDGAASWALARLGLSVFLSMNVMAFTMALWSQDVYVDTPAGSSPATDVLSGLFRYLCLMFALPVLFLLGGPLWSNARTQLRQGRWNMDLLLLSGVLASYLYSAFSVIRDEGPVYFEVGCVVLVLVTFGRWLEATGRLRATASLDALQRLLPETARVQRDGVESEIPLAEVIEGDRLRVLPGERVPCDAIVAGQAIVADEQALSGESRPVVKETGAVVYGGSLIVDGEGFLTVAAIASQGTLARLMERVREARLTKGRFERLADRVSACFLPAVLFVALAAFGWHAHWHGPERGLLTALAVLLIACPCSLGLATPLALWAALGQAARAGVVFRSGEALERLAGVRIVFFDKTGTLTTGNPRVAEFRVGDPSNEEDILRLSARLARGSTHGYSTAICRFAADRLGEFSSDGSLDDGVAVRSFPGRGLSATLPGQGEVFLGSPRFLIQTSHTWKPELQADALGPASTVCLGCDGKVAALFALVEQLRPEAQQALTELRALGVELAMLTGDGEARGQEVGKELGLVAHTELLPEAKLKRIAEARARLGLAAMVGDGLNDALALTGSDVGIALGCGTDLARDSAAVCLIGDDLRRLPWAFRLARRTVRVIRRNLFWAFAYNVAGIGLACTGRLNPIVAAVAMVLSSLFVVTNSLRLGDVPLASDAAPAGAVSSAPLREGVV